MVPRNFLPFVAALIVFQSGSSDAAGKLLYGDKCSVQSALLSVLSLADTDDNLKCNNDLGLLCTGTCTCLPTRVWDSGFLFGLLGGGSCVVGANGPCARGDRCVANAACGGNIPLCMCKDGYYAHDLQCISRGVFSINAATSSIGAGSVLSILTLILVQIFALN